jgi:uncharacterized membrane protein
MGVTGSGKSTFISRIVGGGAKVGHDLVSCKDTPQSLSLPYLVSSQLKNYSGTNEIESYSFTYNELLVHLIDTPGFDDTFRTDSDVLKDIVFWLNTGYKENIQLSGIVYLHPITKNRVTGSTLKNLRMFHKLCGNESLPSVVLATTMWKNVDENDGERRQEELKSTPNFWGEMVANGSRVFRHEDNRASAMNIITYILDQRKRTILHIQREMVDEGKRLDETSAGQELERELLKQREVFEKRLREAQEEMQEALQEGNRKAIEEAMEQQARFQKKLDEAFKGSSELKITMKKLLEQKEVQYEKALQDLESERQRIHAESKQTTQMMEGLQLKMKAREDQSMEEQRRHRLEIDEMSIRFIQMNLKSHASLQSCIAEQNRLTALRPADSISVRSTGNASAFEDSFGETAGAALGQAVGATAGLIGFGITAAFCAIM